MSTQCGSCGADPGVAFSYCPFCGAARASDGAALDHPVAPAPRNAFDRAVTFYQPVDPLVPVPSQAPEPESVSGSGGQVHDPARSPAGFGDAAPTVMAGSPGAQEVDAPVALAYLVGRRGAHPGSVHRLLHEVIIGRGDEADITLADPAVSKRQARVRYDGGSFTFEDLGSSNVSLLLPPGGEPRRITGTQKLTDGDTLVLGETHQRVLIIDLPESGS
jgi:hypothetical protein